MVSLSVSSLFCLSTNIATAGWYKLLFLEERHFSLKFCTNILFWLIYIYTAMTRPWIVNMNTCPIIVWHIGIFVTRCVCSNHKCFRKLSFALLLQAGKVKNKTNGQYVTVKNKSFTYFHCTCSLFIKSYALFE